MFNQPNASFIVIMTAPSLPSTNPYAPYLQEFVKISIKALWSCYRQDLFPSPFPSMPRLLRQLNLPELQHGPILDMLLGDSCHRLPFFAHFQAILLPNYSF